MENRQKTLIKYAVASVLSLLISLAICAAKGAFSLSGKDLLHVLSDAFSIPGLLYVCIGILMLLTRTGIYDGIGYVVQNTIRSLFPLGRSRKQKTYRDYVENRRSKASSGYGFIVIVGLVDILASVVVLIFYYK